MSEKIIEKVFKILCLIEIVMFGCMFICGFFPGAYEKENVVGYFFDFFGLICFLNSLVLIFLPCFGNFVLDHVKAEKIPFNTRDLRNYLEKNLKNTDFKEMISVKTESVDNIKVYVNKPINDRLTYLYYIEGNNLNKETINEVSDVVDQKIVEYYNDNAPKEKKDVILLLSVDKFSPLLKYYTNRNLIQDTVLREGHIIAVYVQEEGMLYVTKQVRGYGISFYKRLRKDLFDILEIQNVEKDSK